MNLAGQRSFGKPALLPEFLAILSQMIVKTHSVEGQVPPMVSPIHPGFIPHFPKNVWEFPNPGGFLLVEGYVPDLPVPSQEWDHVHRVHKSCSAPTAELLASLILSDGDKKHFGKS
jgi:hypothetical protein